MNDRAFVKTPAHLWIVGGISLLWNAMGAAVYMLTMMRHPLAMDGADAAMVAAIDASPLWSNAAWGIGVWGAVAGSVLLLCRSRLAFTAFVASLAGLIVVGTYELVSAMPVNVPQMASIWAIALFLLWYSRKQAKSGVLR